MKSVDLYEVLNIEKTATKKEIIQAYRTLVKKYHPDKPTGNADLFELINHAFDVLTNEEKKRKYDEMEKMSEKVNKTHEQIKNEYKTYKELQDNSEIKKTKEQAELDYNAELLLLDEKRKFDRKQYEEEQKNKITTEELTSLEQDLILEREQDEIEYQPDNLFQNKQFNLDQFNKMWEVANSKNNALTVSNDQSAFNQENDFVSCNTDYDLLYGNDNGEYSGVNFNNPLDTLTIDDLKEIDNVESSYSSHNKDRGSDDYKKSLEELMKEREQESEKLMNMTFSEFNTDIEKDGFGFLHEVGFTKDYELEHEDNEQMKERFSKLLELRENETKTN